MSAMRTQRRDTLGDSTSASLSSNMLLGLLGCAVGASLLATAAEDEDDD